MFAPSRLLTPREQALIVGIIAALLIGSASLYYHRNRPPDPEPESVEVMPSPAPPRADPQHESPIPAESGAVTTPDLPPTMTQDNPVSTPVTAEPEPMEPLGVAAMGAVSKPGLYYVDPGARVADLIAAAGGLTDNADISGISLTARVLDESTLTVPSRSTSTPDGRHGNTDSLYYNPDAYLLTARPALMRPVPVSDTDAASAPAISSVAPPDSTTKQILINLNTATESELTTLPGIGSVLAGRIVAERANQPFVSVDDLRRVPGIADKRIEALRGLVTAP